MLCDGRDALATPKLSREEADRIIDALRRGPDLDDEGLLATVLPIVRLPRAQVKSVLRRENAAVIGLVDRSTLTLAARAPASGDGAWWLYYDVRPTSWPELA